jgi:ABC-type Fe2+-enterobactin transport system substrate-binding protein
MPTIADLIAERADDPSTALLFEDAAWSYAELAQEAAARASLLATVGQPDFQRAAPDSMSGSISSVVHRRDRHDVLDVGRSTLITRRPWRVLPRTGGAALV